MRFFIPISDSLVRKAFTALNLGAQVGIMVGFNRLNASVNDVFAQKMVDKGRDLPSQSLKPR